MDHKYANTNICQTDLHFAFGNTSSLLHQQVHYIKYIQNI
jgi:hypothetical protein